MYWFTRLVLFGVALALVPDHLPAQSTREEHPSARILVQRALAAMGGAETLEALHAVKLSGVTYENHLYEREPRDQAAPVTFQTFTEVRDLDHAQLRRTSSAVSLAGSGNGGTTVETTADGVTLLQVQGAAIARPAHDAWLALSPERLFLTALAAHDLRAAPDTTVRGVPQHVITFTWNRSAVHVLLNAFTNLPTAVEYVDAFPESTARGIWGDVNMRVFFSNWGLWKGGVHYPLQYDTEWNGVPYTTTAVSDLVLDPDLSGTDWSMPEDARRSVRLASVRTADSLPLGTPRKPAAEIEQNVVQIPGSWYTTLIRQADGVVVLEAPISSGYSAKVIAEAQRRFPGVPIKAVISTSNYWWHFAGIREYVARGIPVYALDVNRALLERAVHAPHRLHPDDLARAPRAMRLHSVSGRLVLGTGPNRVELYPIRTSTTSQMLMVYFPQYQLLYSSDMAQPLGPGGSFLFPQYLWDLRRAVRENGLSVKTLIGMHMSPTPWGKLEVTLDSLGAGAALPLTQSR